MLASVIPLEASAAGIRDNHNRVPIEKNFRVPIEKNFFPDEAFRTYIKDSVDANKDGRLSLGEIKNAVNMEVEYRGISSLKGVEVFFNLETLSCSNNSIKSLNLNKNKKLRTVNCNNNKLESLNLSECTELEAIYCINNNIKELSLTNNRKLKYLVCDNNKLTELTVEDCSYNFLLSCNYNLLSKIELPQEKKKVSIYCENNKLRYLNLHNHEIRNIAIGVQRADVVAVKKDGKWIMMMFPIIIGGDIKYIDKSFFNKPGEYSYNSGTGIITFEKEPPASITNRYEVGDYGSGKYLARFTLRIDPVTCRIDGDAKYDSTLTAVCEGKNNQYSNLKYTWFSNGSKISGATGSTYKVKAGDIGKVISVSAGNDGDWAEWRTEAATATVQKADGLSMNVTLKGVAPSVKDGKGSISGLTSAMEIKGGALKDYTKYGTAGTKELMPGKYSVRYAETETHRAGQAVTVVVPEFAETLFAVKVVSGTGSGSYKAGDTVKITADAPADGMEFYQWTVVSGSVVPDNIKSASAQFKMPEFDVELKATYKKAEVKPEITIDEAGGSAVFSDDGKELVITPKEGYEIENVTVNGTDRGAVDRLTGLSPTDKIVVVFKKKPAEADNDAAVEKKVKAMKFTMKAKRTSAKKTKVTVYPNSRTREATDEIKNMGYTVKYKYYSSLKKSKGYKYKAVKKTKTYINKGGKKGRVYYYKAKMCVYDKNGVLVAQTKFSQCGYTKQKLIK